MESEIKASTGVQSRVTPLAESREGNYRRQMAFFSQRPAEQQRSEQAKEEEAATARCPKPQPGEGSHSKQLVGAEVQPQARHTTAQQRCEGHSVLNTRCGVVESAEPEAEHTLMAGVAKQETADEVGRGKPSLHEKPERKEKLELR